MISYSKYYFLFRLLMAIRQKKNKSLAYFYIYALVSS